MSRIRAGGLLIRIERLWEDDIRIAVIGDVHGCWTDADLRYFEAADVDLVLFVGDLPARTDHADTLDVARRLAAIDKPAMLMPGNHDATAPIQVLAEAFGRGRGAGWSLRQGRAMAELEAALSPIQLVGYSRHTLAPGLDLIAARPGAMDGRHLTFAPWLRSRYGVGDLGDSAAKLRDLVDQSDTERLVFLAHNGPSGAGALRTDTFGLGRPERDNGDPDLASAVRYAQRQGKKVLAVLAGHMHHRGHGGRRRWTTRMWGTQVVNAARVPRVYERGSATWHHHVRVDIEGEQVRISEVNVRAGGQPRL